MRKGIEQMKYLDQSVLLLVFLPSAAMSATPEKVFQIASRSVVVVHTLNASHEQIAEGSGVVVAKEEVVTNCRLLESGELFRVQVGTSFLTATIGAANWDSDLCHLNVPGLSVLSAKNGSSKSIREIGTNDFRISFMGGTGDSDYVAVRPSVAYNSTNNQYLVVWTGDDNVGDLVDDEREIFGQLLDAATGANVGAIGFRISDGGGTGNPSYGAWDPSAVYNSADNQYLVVWEADDPDGGLVDGEFEIFGQLLNAATGAEVGTNDFRISDMGGTGNSEWGVFELPRVAYNSTDNQYLVVWSGRDGAPEFEIYGQRLAATGAEVGTNDFRISDMGGTGDSDYGAYRPFVAYNSTDNQYLVVWYGDDNVGGLVSDEYEIFGQLLAPTGAELGANDFRISDMGGTANTNFAASLPSVAYNSTDNQYFVVWTGDDNVGDLVDDEREIFGQLLDAATGAEIGANDFLISDMGGTGYPSYNAYYSSVAFNSTDNQYLVVWEGDDNVGDLVDDEYEIFGQRLAATGAEVGANDFRISDMGGTGDPSYNAYYSSVAFNSTSNRYLVVWEGDDNVGDLVDDEYEIFGQGLESLLFADGFESGDTSAWSKTVP